MIEIIKEVENYAASKSLPTPYIIGASKTQDVAAIQKAKRAGLQSVGENYIQELHQKWAEKAYTGLHVFFIGHLQSRKARLAVEICDEIHSVDSLKLAKKLNTACETLGKHLLPIMLQINQGGELQKGGISPAQLPKLLSFVEESCPFLKATGLMTLPPAGQNPAPYFKELSELADKHALPYRNMGMSADWKTALDHGATHIRLGTALFGARKKAAL